MNEGTKNILRLAGLKHKVDLVEAGRCPSCEKAVNKALLNDALSVKEHEITGLCKPCMGSISRVSAG